jgi:hypothetical protein
MVQAVERVCVDMVPDLAARGDVTAGATRLGHLSYRYSTQDVKREEQVVGASSSGVLCECRTDF